MLSKIVAVALAVAVGLPAISALSTNANADPEWRDRSVRKYQRKQVAKKWTRRDDAEYEARANNLDPAGNYKGYANWARVALSPKYDRGFR